MCDHAPDREAAMVVTHRHPDGRPKVWCDPCLVPLVRALNDGGVPTVASCCGHGNLPPSVCLADGRVVLVLNDLAQTVKLERYIQGSVPAPSMQGSAGSPESAARLSEGSGE